MTPCCAALPLCPALLCAPLACTLLLALPCTPDLHPLASHTATPSPHILLPPYHILLPSGLMTPWTHDVPIRLSPLHPAPTLLTPPPPWQAGDACHDRGAHDAAGAQEDGSGAPGGA